MSRASSENRGKLLPMPHSLENINSDPSKKYQLKYAESPFSCSQSPKFSIQMLADLQDQLRLKEIDLIEANKAKRRLEVELSEVKKSFEEKDCEINRLIEENLNLKTQLREGDYNMTDY